MAYPTNSLQKLSEQIDSRMIAIRRRVVSDQSRMAAGNIPSIVVTDLLIELRNFLDYIDSVKDTPGLADQIRRDKNDDTIDAVAEATAVIAAVQDVADWINANYPKDGSGNLLERTFVDGLPVYNSWAPAQTAPLRTELEKILNAIAP